MNGVLKTLFNVAVIGTCGAFFHELFVFPWAHDSYFGQQVMSTMSETLVPMYNEVGSFFGVEPPGQIVPNLPIVNLTT